MELDATLSTHFEWRGTLGANFDFGLTVYLHNNNLLYLVSKASAILKHGWFEVSTANMFCFLFLNNFFFLSPEEGRVNVSYSLAL